MVVVGGFRGRWQSFAGCCVFRASLLALLSGRGHSLGRCCRSWTAWIVRAGGLCLPLHGIDVLAKRMVVVVGRCVEVVGGIVGVVVVG